jgi:hypothetical protein
MFSSQIQFTNFLACVRSDALDLSERQRGLNLRSSALCLDTSTANASCTRKIWELSLGVNIRIFQMLGLMLG